MLLIHTPPPFIPAQLVLEIRSRGTADPAVVLKNVIPTEAGSQKKYKNNSARVVRASRNLAGRRLICFEEYEHVRGVFFTGDWAVGDLVAFLPGPKDAQADREATVVELTLEGWDLGRKYSHWVTRTGLWWAEYKGHWIWSIVAAAITFLIGWLVGGLTN